MILSIINMRKQVLTFRMQFVAFIVALFIIPPVVTFCIWRVFINGWRNFFNKRVRIKRPEVLDDSTYGHHGFIRRKNGTRLHYVAKGPRDRPLLLLLHGFPESWYSWRYQLKELSFMYRVVALDLRGFGESDKPRGLHNYSMDIIAEDISETIKALGYKKCVLVGHELGGMVAMTTACLYGHQVDRLILLNSPHLLTHLERMSSSLQHLIKSLYVIFINIPWLPEIVIRSEDFRWLKTAMVGFLMGASRGTYDRNDIEAVRYYMGYKGTLPASLSYYRTMYRKKYMNKYPTSSIYTPTLLLWGTADFVFETYLPVMMKSSFLKNARLQFLQGASHWLQQEQPEKVNEYILDFVENEDSNLYLDDHFLEHPHEGSDTLDEIEDGILDEGEIAWSSGGENEKDRDSKETVDVDVVSDSEGCNPQILQRSVSRSDPELYKLVSVAEDGRNEVNSKERVEADTNLREVTAKEVSHFGKVKQIKEPNGIDNFILSDTMLGSVDTRKTVFSDDSSGSELNMYT